MRKVLTLSLAIMLIFISTQYVRAESRNIAFLDESPGNISMIQYNEGYFIMVLPTKDGLGSGCFAYSKFAVFSDVNTQGNWEISIVRGADVIASRRFQMSEKPLNIGDRLATEPNITFTLEDFSLNNEQRMLLQAYPSETVGFLRFHVQALDNTGEFEDFYLECIDFSSDAMVGEPSKKGDDGVTNWNFIRPVRHKTTVPDGYIGIYTAKDLDNIRNDFVEAEINVGNPGHANIKNYILMNNIDLTEWGEWVPIGDGKPDFSGTFDGNGYVIENMTIKESSAYAGLFGSASTAYVEQGDGSGFRAHQSNILNLGLTGINIELTTTDGFLRVGGIVGDSSGLVDNCYTSGEISVKGPAEARVSAGGIAGFCNSVENCYNSSSIRSSGEAGGITAQSFRIRNCFNSGYINGGTHVGGIAANVLNDTLVTSCYNTGVVSGNSSVNGVRAGGIVGSLYNADILSDCYNWGDVRILDGPAPESMDAGFDGCNTAGGIAGYIDFGGFSNCYNMGNFYIDPSLDKTLCGAIAGNANGLREKILITNCYYKDDPIEAIGHAANAVTNNTKALTMDQIREKTSFVGFDFDNIWDIDINANYGCPYLRSFVSWNNPYADVTDDDWFYEAVRFATKNKLMNGIDSDTFSPSATLTRAMLVTMLYRLEGQPAVKASQSFKDVDEGRWYSAAILWADENSIVEGYDNFTFGLNDSVTREQVATVLYRYDRLKRGANNASVELSTFADKDDISKWALDALKWAVSNGIIQGRATNTITPKVASTRAEVALTFMRYVDGVDAI